ncbi:hypothetical protein Hanom_Chr06g00579621 [Helianthus anomalus]
MCRAFAVYRALFSIHTCVGPLRFKGHLLVAACGRRSHRLNHINSCVHFHFCLKSCVRVEL